MKNRSVYLSIISMTLLASCSEEPVPSSIQVSEAREIDSLPGSAPFLGKDAGGNIVMSWARSLNDSTSMLCYSVYDTTLHAFNQPIVVPGSENLRPHAENLPKVIFRPNGGIVALWGAPNPNSTNKYAGLVYYNMSFDYGKTWTGTRTLVSDTASPDQRYYDVALLPGGEVGIVWLDNRKTGNREGSSLYFAKTNNLGGFVNERKITEGCCQCCRTDLMIDDGGAIHVMFRGIIQDSIRDILHTVSMDGGKSFNAPRLVSDDHWVLKGCPHTGPSMCAESGLVHLAWFTGGDKKGVYYTSTSDNGNTFKPSTRISDHGSHPQMTSLGKNVLMTWDEDYATATSFAKQVKAVFVTLDGAITEITNISDKSDNASYPVVVSESEKAAIVGFTIRRKDKEYIEWREIGGKVKIQK